MIEINTYKTLKILKIDNKKYFFHDLNTIANLFSFNLSTIPSSLKILLENLLRYEDGETITSYTISNFCDNLKKQTEKTEIFFNPTRDREKFMVCV